MPGAPEKQTLDVPGSASTWFDIPLTNLAAYTSKARMASSSSSSVSISGCFKALETPQ